MTQFLPWYVDDPLGGRHINIRNARGRLVISVIVQMAGYRGLDLSAEYDRRQPEALETAHKIVALANEGKL